MKRRDVLPDLDPCDEREALRLAWPDAPWEVWADLAEAIEEQRQDARPCPVVNDYDCQTPRR
jgi:hypothetical protein